MLVKAIIGSWFEFLNHWAFFYGGAFCLSFTLDFFSWVFCPLFLVYRSFFSLLPLYWLRPLSPRPLFSVVVSTNCQAKPTFSLSNKSGADTMFLVLGVVPFFCSMAHLIINIIVKFFLLVVLFCPSTSFFALFPLPIV
jgi:hypothetical protein